MLDLTTQRQIVEEYVGDNFSSAEIRFENAQLPKEGKVWIQIHDKQTRSDSTGFSETTALVGGTLIIGIFVPRNTGTAKARAIAQELATLLGNKELEGIGFQEPEFHGSPGGDSNIPWYQMNLVIPYSGVFGQSYENC